jgi:hypothetical protein
VTQEKRFSPVFYALLAAAAAAGILIARIDSKPTWDDAGITAGIIFTTSAMLGTAMPRRAWIWGLAVGGWIPLFGIVGRGDPATLLALAAGMAGAYAGAGIRKLLDGGGS